MTNTKSRIISVFLILALVLTVNTVPAFAASKSNLNLSAKATGQHTVALKWNKVSKAYNGYAIFRNGEVIKYGNSKTLKFTDSKLKAGTKYTYQVKTYKVKKVKKWYNKKTKKWQTKKPAKKYRGKSKKVVSYSYKTKSKVITVRTDSKPVDPSSPSNNPSDPSESTKEYTITWKNYNGNTLKTDKVKAGDKPKYIGSTPTKPETDKYTYEFDGWNPSLVAASENTSYTAKFKAIEKTTSYSYNIHVLDEPYGGTDEVIMAVYVETNNPNVYNYELGILDSNNKVKKLNISKVYYKGSSATTTYEDLELPFTKGYLAICRPECTGNCKIIINEYNDEGRSIVATKSVYIKNYYAEESAWRQSVINQVTNSSMSKEEKMNAICNYLLNNFNYTKIPNGTIPNVSPECHYITLLADAGTPYWIEKRLNSYTSPELLVKFGQDIGYSLHNCYNDYPEGSAEWKIWHMKVYSEVDDKYYSACPNYTTGYIDTSSIVIFNPNTYQFWGE